jgi:hypothetical protein
MTRRAPLQALVQAMLVATLTCPLFSTAALADPDQGSDQRHGEKHGYGRSDEQHQSGNDNRGNGRGGNSGRGNSAEPRQDRDDYRGNGDRYRNNDERYNANDNRDRGNDDRNHDDDGRYHGSENTDRGNGRNAQQRQALSPQGAAQQARAQFGGQVLKVQPSGRGYQVRLLKEDGRVVNVSIGE